MKFNDAEMLFFNSLLDGKGIFGLNIKKPFVADKDFIQKTIEGLKKKDIISPQGNLIDKHPNPIIQLQFYKQASTYIAFDQMRIALADSGDMIAIAFDKEGYQIFSCQTWRFLHEMFLNTPILNELKDRYITGSEKEINLQKYIRKLSSDEYEKGVVFKKYNTGTLSEEYTLLWNNDAITCYDGIACTEKRVSGQEVRILLLNLFELMKK